MIYLGRDGVAVVERGKDDDPGVATERDDGNYADRHDRDGSREKGREYRTSASFNTRLSGKKEDSHVGLVQVGHGQASLYHCLIHRATGQPAEVVADDDRPEGVSRRRI